MAGLAVSAPEPYVWFTKRDRDADVMAAVVAALCNDYEAAAGVFESLNRRHLTELAWCLAGWYAAALRRNVSDPLATLQEFAIARDLKEGDEG
jgi:hypothetical protein